MSAHSGKSPISVIVPLRNAENWVVPLVEDIHNTITSKIPNSEIVLVDDQSKDKTWTILRALTEAYQEVRIYRLRESSGVGPCTIRGFLEAKSRYLFHIEPHCAWKADIFWPMAAKRSEMGKGAVFAIRPASSRALRERAVFRLFRDDFLEKWKLPVPDAAPPAVFFSRTDFERVHVLLPENSFAPILSLYLMLLYNKIPVETHLLPPSKPSGMGRRAVPALFSGLQPLRVGSEEIERLRKNLNRIDGLLTL